MNHNKANLSVELNNYTQKISNDEHSGNLDQSNNELKKDKSFNYDNTIRSLSNRLCEIDTIIADLSKNYKNISNDSDKISDNNYNIEKYKEMINDMHIKLGTTTQRFNKHEAEINEKIKEVIQTSIRNTIEIDEWE